jgi:hypothetical protein
LAAREAKGFGWRPKRLAQTGARQKLIFCARTFAVCPEKANASWAKARESGNENQF